MRRGYSVGGLDEAEGVETVVGLIVANFALNSTSPLHHQPAANAASIMHALSIVANKADVGRKDA